MMCRYTILLISDMVSYSFAHNPILDFNATVNEAETKKSSS